MRAAAITLIMSLMTVLPLLAADASSLVTTVPGETPRFTMVDSKLDEISKVAEITLKSPTGIFTFDYHPPKLELKTARLIVLKESSCEGLTFWPRGGKAVQLREIEGCTIRREGESLVIDLTGVALKSLGAGGKVQFVNAYR